MQTFVFLCNLDLMGNQTWPQSWFYVARKQANSRSTTKCAGPTRYFSMPPLLSVLTVSLFLLLWPPPCERLLVSGSPQASGGEAQLAGGGAAVWRRGHPSISPSLSLQRWRRWRGPTSQAGSVVVFSGDGGLPGLLGPLTFPERRPWSLQWLSGPRRGGSHSARRGGGAGGSPTR